jgi:hypothetical protein
MDTSKRNDYESPLTFGWVLTTEDGVDRVRVRIWDTATFQEAGDGFNATPLYTMKPSQARTVGDEARRAADQADVVTSLLPIVRDAGGDVDIFAEALLGKISDGQAAKALSVLSGAFGRRMF